MISNRIEIPLSKMKMVLMLAGSVLFVTGGAWVATIPWSKVELPAFMAMLPPWVFPLIGLAAILFFGACGVSIFLKLFSSRPGLVITNEGFIDNSGGASAGFVPWSTVTGVDIMTVSSQKFIRIGVLNAEELIEKQKSGVRFLMRQNYKWYGSPLGISANGLKISFDELLRLLQDKHLEYQRMAAGNATSETRTYSVEQ